MIRTQISLTEEQMERLRRESARTGKSMAQLVREALDRVLADEEYEVRAEQILAIAGRFPGPPDLAENHDEYFVQSIEEETAGWNRR